jgi:hypothetical protein
MYCTSTTSQLVALFCLCDRASTIQAVARLAYMYVQVLVPTGGVGGPKTPIKVPYKCRGTCS